MEKVKNRPPVTDLVLLRSAHVFRWTTSPLRMHWIFQGKKSERRKIECRRVSAYFFQLLETETHILKKARHKHAFGLA